MFIMEYAASGDVFELVPSTHKFDARVAAIRVSLVWGATCTGKECFSGGDRDGMLRMTRFRRDLLWKKVKDMSTALFILKSLQALQQQGICPVHSGLRPVHKRVGGSYKSTRTARHQHDTSSTLGLLPSAQLTVTFSDATVTPPGCCGVLRPTPCGVAARSPTKSLPLVT